MNLIPQGPASSYDYWCTWNTQYTSLSSFAGGEEGVVQVRNNLNEKLLFDSPGIISKYFNKCRNDLYVVFDDGWDVDYNQNPGKNISAFGSCKLSEKRFSSCNGNPAERLKKLDTMVKSLGWKGAGLWISAQAEGEKRGAEFDISYLEKYWRERAKWCNYAGINYWKVDWGIHAHDMEFRRMLTKIAKEEAPLLKVEHAYCMGPFNSPDTKDGRFSSSGDWLNKNVDVLSFSDILRTYDVTSELSAASTIDRVSELLSNQKMESGCDGILNVEDELYLGAALGCIVGVMRHPIWNESIIPDEGNRRLRIDEIVRTVRWHRIAPPYGVWMNKFHKSKEILCDNWFFDKTYDWAGVEFKSENQSAPMAISRGMDIPEVIAPNDKPFVVASKNPISGAVSIATIPRTYLGRGLTIPSADITIEVDGINTIIGIFGEYRSLTIDFSESVEGMDVWAQDLSTDEALKITDRIHMDGHHITLDGKTIKEIGTLGATPGDFSYPGLALVLKK